MIVIDDIVCQHFNACELELFFIIGDDVSVILLVFLQVTRIDRFIIDDDRINDALSEKRSSVAKCSLAVNAVVSPGCVMTLQI